MELVFNNVLPKSALNRLQELGYEVAEVEGGIQITKLSTKVSTYELEKLTGDPPTQVDIRDKESGRLLAIMHKGSIDFLWNTLK